MEEVHMLLGASYDVKRAKPTKNHRPAIWENMLGTVYAMDDNRKIKYFDYDYEAAKAYSNVAEKKDIRLAKVTEPLTWDGSSHANPRKGKLVIWVEK
jgi:hypothetical protein